MLLARPLLWTVPQLVLAVVGQPAVSLSESVVDEGLDESVSLVQVSKLWAYQSEVVQRALNDPLKVAALLSL
jgi:hypothetical protein